jgi:hypothetical protein
MGIRSANGIVLARPAGSVGCVVAHLGHTELGHCPDCYCRLHQYAVKLSCQPMHFAWMRGVLLTCRLVQTSTSTFIAAANESLLVVHVTPRVLHWLLPAVFAAR